MADVVRGRGIGQVYHYWATVFLDEHNLYLPDFVVFPAGAGTETDWEELGVPLLAVEVLSPSTAKYDRGAKRPHYIKPQALANTGSLIWTPAWWNGGDRATAGQRSCGMS